MRRHATRRFTPTCVGNTPVQLGPSGSNTVHPHVCGEYFLLFYTLINYGGSPPRVWGIPLWGREKQSNLRFTPTCVGNTLLLMVTLISVTVHPHVCGEYVSLLFLQALSAGSPPRVWGILRVNIYPNGGLRFTPTCVGNTFSLRTVKKSLPVHPHVCGEY